MSQSLIIFSLILLAPVEPPGAVCGPHQSPSPLPIPRYIRPAWPAGEAWYAPDCSPSVMKACGGIQWHTAQKVGRPASPVIHLEVDTMEFRPTDALPADARACVW